MAKGLSLHIGLNEIDPSHYDEWLSKLKACENDAKDMKDIADKCGFESTLLLAKEANYLNVLKQISLAASKLEKDDIFLITYSGHGTQIKDVSGDETTDQMDETWALYDRMIIDDELYQLWSTFAAGVRIVVISDSCHSESIAKDSQDYSISDALVARSLPGDIALNTYLKHKNMYDASQWLTARGHEVQILASIISISACQDNQSAYDGEKNGRFTCALKNTWNEGRFEGSYYKFYEGISPNLPPIQSPKYNEFGAENEEFQAQNVFTI
jgi:metacaspase-1